MDIQPNRKLILAINSPDSLFTDTTAIRRYITGDSGKKYGLTFYSENEIHKLQQQKNIDSMTVEDFKLYAGKLSQFRAEMDSLSKMKNEPNGLLYYGYSMIRNIIGEVGYNPLVTTDEFEKFIKRFQDNPETKEICQKLF